VDTNLGNNVKKLDALPGMPGGFAFAMVLLGIALGVLGSVFGGINEFFFRAFGSGALQVGLQLIEWGAVLQGVLWVCAAFARKSNPPGGTQ
jgi:hypothetical protein